MPAPARNAKGRFVKSGGRRSPGGGATTAVVVATPARAPARRSRSSPYAVASRRRRSSASGYAPTKKFAAGAVLGIATSKFSSAYQRLPELGGTRMVAVAGLAHLARRTLPHGQQVAEAAAAIAGWEVGRAQASRLGLSGGGGGDDF